MEEKRFIMKATKKRFHGSNLILMITKPENCGGRCVYCISNDTGNGGLVDSEVMVYAADHNWSAAKQIEFGKQILSLKTPGNKLNLAIKGDSFTNYQLDYIDYYLKNAYDQVNGVISENLDDALRIHRKSKDKITTISVATRPDLINDSWCLELVKLGVTTVELGVQSLDDDVLTYIERGHDTEAVRKATALLRRYGFEIGYHLMPGLPGSSLEKDCLYYTNTLWSDAYQPDFIKLYPCIMLSDTSCQKRLLKLLQTGEWMPLSNADYKSFLYRILPKMPQYISINRYNRMIPRNYISAGPDERVDTNEFCGVSNDFLQRAFQYSKHFNHCYETIHFQIETVEYGQANYFLQAIFPDKTVLGCLRMTLYPDDSIIRDLRVFGNPAKLSDTDAREPGCIQHLGIGKALMRKAEEITRSKKCLIIRVHAPAGDNEYFKKLGYSDARYYMMEKSL